MDRRNNSRVAVQLPVQVWGVDAYGQPFMELAIVTNMSSTGLVLQGLRRKIRSGDLLDIRMDNERAQFRVVWIGGIIARYAGNLGMQRVTAQAFLPSSVLAHCAQAAAAC